MMAGRNGGAGGPNGGLPTGGNGGCYAYNVDSSLENETRAIIRIMDGPQPTEDDWSMFFCRVGGSMSSKLADLMRMAHNVAKAQHAKDPSA